MKHNYPSFKNLPQLSVNSTTLRLRQFLLVLTLLFSVTVASAQPCSTSIDFSSPITTGATQAPNTWYTDRYAPASFSSPSNYLGDDRLLHSISTAEGAVNRPSAQQGTFYNTQGRKLDLISGAKSIEIKLYIPSAWGSSNKRMAGLWGTATDAANGVSAYPILEFTSDAPGPRFRAYETGTGAWVDLGLPTGFAYDQWVTLKIQLLASGEFRYTVGNLQHTTTTSAPDASKQITDVILQGYNYDPNQTLDATNPGVNYDIYWDDFLAKAGDGVVTNTNTSETFCSIQAAIDDPDTQTGHTITVSAGNYNEDVLVNKSLVITGAGAGSTTISGPMGGSVSTLQISANAVTVAGFTITRDGNNPTDWNNPGLNSAGIGIQGQSITGATIRDNIFIGNRTGIDINHSNGHTIRNNIINNNRTGLIFRNQTDNITFTENVVTDNWTVGIVFLDASGGTNSPVQTASGSNFTNNNISGNWYGQMVDRQSGGSLPAPGTTNLKNFSGNWYGTTSPVVTTANSAEPGYAVQIPVIYGGTATAPGGQPDIAGPASANIDFTPFLNSGTDTNVETTAGRGTNGFQGSFSTLWATAAGAQTGATTRIQEGVNTANASGVLNVKAGTYTENILVNKSLTINGPNVGIAGTGTRNPEAILSDGSINVTGATVVIDGFHVYQTNNTNEVVVLGGSSQATVQNSKFERVGVTPGQTVRAIVTSSGSGVKTIKDNLFTGSTAGSLFGSHVTWQSGIYLNAASSTVNVTGNTFENVRTAINIDDHNAGITISGNTFKVNGTQLSFGGTSPTSGSYTLGANAFNTPASGSINLSNVANTFRLNITTSTYNGAAFNTLPLATLFQFESTILHRGRSGRNGLVTYVAGNQYVINGQTTIQSAIDYGTTGDVVHVSGGSFNETITVNKNLTFEGANKDVCGTSNSRVAETILVAPATATGVITLSGSVTATFNGFLIDGMGVAYLSQPNQGLVFKNSVFELDFLPSQNNIYMASSSLILDCNYFKAIGGTNNGGSSHIFVGGTTSLTAVNNKFTSQTAIGAITGSTTERPVWLNLTDNSTNSLVQNNEFSFIDLGILLASSTGNLTIRNNEFSNATRDAHSSGAGYGAGIAIFNAFTPSGPVLIQNNKFFNSETGVRTSASSAGPFNFPTPALLTISNNSFVNLPNGSFRIGNSYNSSSNALNATCNWYNNAPIVTGNPSNITYLPQLASGTDDQPGTLGFQQNTPVCVLATQFYVNDNSQSGDGFTSSVGNDANPGTAALPFRTINRAISVAGTGATILVDAGTYNENVDVNKTLTIEGWSTASVILTPTSASTGVGIAINAADVVIKKLTVDKYQYGININASGMAHKLLDVKATNNSLNGISVPYGAAPEAAAITGLEINNVQATGNGEAGLLVFATVAGSKVFDNVTITSSDFSNNAKKGIYLERAKNLVIDNVTINNSGTDLTNGNNNNGIDINLKFGIYSGITIKNSTITNSGVTGTGGDPANPSAIAIKARRDGGTYGANPATLTNVLIDNNTISGPQNGIRVGEPGQTNDGTSGVTIQKNNLSASFANKALVNRTAANITLLCNYFGPNTDYANVVPKLAAVGTGKNLLTSIATNTTYSSCISPTGFAVSTSTPEVCAGSPSFILATGLLPSTSTTVSFNINGGSTETFTGTTTGAGGLLIDKTLPAGSYTMTVTSVEANNTISSVNPPMSVSFIVKPNVVAGTVSGTSPIAIGATTTYTNTGGTAGGTWSSSNTSIATVNSAGLVTGVASGTANIIYTVTGCGGTVSSQAKITVQPAPDLSPTMRVNPTLQYGNSNFTVVVDVYELNSSPSSGTVVVYVTKNNQISLTLPSSATSVGGRPVQNGAWTMTSNATYYVLTTSAVIPAGDILSFGLEGVLTPNGSSGALSISAAVFPGSGGEIKTNNNNVAIKVDYFAQ